MPRLRTKKTTTSKDVQDCTDKELTYDSSWNNWKIKLDSSVNGTKTLNVPGGGDGYVDITHTLGYAPACEVWIYDGTNNFLIPGPDVGVNYQFDAYIDSSKIRVCGRDEGGGAKSFTVKYKVYYERIDT